MGCLSTGSLGSGLEVTLNLKTEAQPELGPSIRQLALSVDDRQSDILHLKITDAQARRGPLNPILVLFILWVWMCLFSIIGPVCVGAPVGNSRETFSKGEFEWKR